MAVLEIPDLPPFVTNGRGRYLCTYESHWDSALKQPRRTSTRTVGKLIPVKGRDDLMEVLFKDEFIDSHPGLDHMRVFRRKGGKLEFKPREEDEAGAGDGDGLPAFTLEQRVAVRKLHGGATWALNCIAADSPIGRTLSRAFPRHALDRKILSLAYYIILRGNNAMYRYTEFAESTWLPYRRPLTGSAISRIFKGISHDDVEAFLRHLSREFRKSCREDAEGRLFLALDSTSISSYSQELPQVEWGRNKDLVELPQVNVLLVVDQKTGSPVYFRSFDGNVPDSSTIRNTIADCTRMGLLDNPRFVLVSDKGYASVSNIDDCLRGDLDFIFNMRARAGGIAGQLASENYSRLLDWNRRDPFLRQTVVTVPLQWEYDSFPVRGKRQLKRDSRQVWAHIYYDHHIHDDAVNIVEENLTAMIPMYNNAPDALSPARRSYVERYCDISAGRASVNMRKVSDPLKLTGVRVLISSAISDPVECCRAYEERSHVEAAFNTLKSRLRCNRNRVCDPGCLEGKLLVEMIATAIAGMARSRIADYGKIQSGGAGNGCAVRLDSDIRLFDKLNNIMMTSFRDGWYFDEIAGKRRELFSVLNVPVPDKQQAAAECDQYADGADDAEGVEEAGNISGQLDL